MASHPERSQSRARAAIPFVGRESELQVLQARYEEATHAGERLVLVRGPDGFGKTRLLAEFRARMRLQGVAVLEGRASTGGRAYAPFSDVLRSAITFLDDVGERVEEEIAPLLFLVGGTSPASEWSTLGAADRRDRFFEQFGRLLRRIARVRPPVVLVDDFDLADAGSFALLQYLADGVGNLVPGAEAALPVLFVCSCRPNTPSADRISSLAGLPNATVLDLAPLGMDGVRELLQSPSIVERVRALCGGSPEAVESLLLGQPADSRDRLAGILARLSPSARGLLDALVVWNRPVTPEVLETLAESESLRAPHIAELCETGLVSRKLVDGEIRLTIARSADRDFLYGSLAEDRRRALHGRIAEWLSRRGVGAAGLQDLARHMLSSARPHDAVPVVLDAADALAAMFAQGEAVTLLEEALPVAAPETREAVLERLVATCEATGQYRRALSYAAELVALRPTDAAAHRQTGELHLHLGEHAEALGCLGRARALLEQVGDERLLPEIVADVAALEYQKGDYDAASRAAVDGLRMLSGHPDDGHPTRLHLRNTMGKVAMALGDMEAAARIFDESRRAAARMGIVSEEIRATANLAIVEQFRGRHAVAAGLLEGSLDLVEARGALRERALYRQNLATLLHERRDYASALHHYHEAVGLLKSLGNRSVLAQVAANLGELYLELGDVQRAQEIAKFADGFLESHARKAAHVEHALLRSRVELALGRTDAARAAAEEARVLAETLAEGRLAGEVAIQLARIDEAEGQILLARRHLLRVERTDRPVRRAQAALLVAKLDRAAGEDSLESARHAVALADEADDDELRWRARTLLAVATLDRGDRRAARDHVQAALRIDTDLRARVPDGFQSWYGSHADRATLQQLVASLADVDVGAAAAPRVAARTEPAVARVVEPSVQRPCGELVGESAAMREVYGFVERVAASDALVLIRGESGTGKELVANAIHGLSSRRDRPLVKVNCAALVETLLLSELFGHERGAFTGAVARKKGWFEVADGGTLFLDEIGDISPRTQVSLLRVLQDGTFERVGGSRSIRVDVRILCATNHDLEALVAEGRFREDLYYRLKGLQVTLPSLRARTDDLPLLASHFLARFAKERGTHKTLGPDALDRLRHYAWPGNVRELENTLRSVALLSDGAVISAKDLADVNEGLGGEVDTAPAPVRVSAPTAPSGGGFDRVSRGEISLADLKREIERECVARALEQTGGNITQAAKLLGMKRPRLSQLTRELGLKKQDRGEGR